MSAYGAWETLYRDPNDGRHWEPHSDWHGPPCLTNITFDAAKEKYKVGN